MKHTPGPWVYDKKFNRIISEKEWSVSPDDNFDGIHTTIIETFGAMGGQETAADIALICAAPDMLLALEQADKWIDDVQLEYGVEDNGILQIIRDAVAKAEGGE
jgi:hypothetical protein